jgi:hypothetical protein
MTEQENTTPAEDVEGHKTRPGLANPEEPTENDVEGHRWRPGGGPVGSEDPTEDDVEGHQFRPGH